MDLNWQEAAGEDARNELRQETGMADDHEEGLLPLLIVLGNWISLPVSSD